MVWFKFLGLSLLSAILGGGANVSVRELASSGGDCERVELSRVLKRNESDYILEVCEDRLIVQNGLRTEIMPFKSHRAGMEYLSVELEAEMCSRTGLAARHTIRVFCSISQDVDSVIVKNDRYGCNRLISIYSKKVCGDSESTIQLLENEWGKEEKSEVVSQELVEELENDEGVVEEVDGIGEEQSGGNEENNEDEGTPKQEEELLSEEELQVYEEQEQTLHNTHESEDGNVQNDDGKSEEDYIADETPPQPTQPHRETSKPTSTILPGEDGGYGDFFCGATLSNWDIIYSYNLTGLEDFFLEASSDKTPKKYAMSICSSLPQKCGNLGYGMVYEFYGNECVNILARWGTSQPLWKQLDGKDYLQGISMETQSGSTCHEVTPSRPYTLEINFLCYKGDTKEKITFYLYDIEPCHFAVDLFSEYSCPETEILEKSSQNNGSTPHSGAAVFFLILVLIVLASCTFVCAYKYKGGARGMDVIPFHNEVRCLCCPGEKKRHYSKVNLNDGSGRRKKAYGTAQMTNVRKHFSL